MDTVAVDYAFFGEHDQTAKPLVIFRWTEAFPVNSKRGQHVSVVRSVADMIRRTGLQRLLFKSDQEPSTLDLKNKVFAELGGWHDVIDHGEQSNE